MRVCVVAVTLALAVESAGAHPLDTYPEQYEIVVRPGQRPAMDVVVGTTYGMIVSHDGGASWGWVCEAGFGVTDSWVPEYEQTAQGIITATTAAGLFTSTDGCTWVAAAGSAGTEVAATSAVGSDGRLWLASGTGQAYVQWSSDGGGSWTRAAGFGVDVLWIESIAVAPSDPQRVYVTGSTIEGAGRRARMWRSDDDGAGWDELDVGALGASDISELQVAAIAPADPSRLYVRVTNASGGSNVQEALFHSVDGGAAWSEALRVDDLIPGVVIRGDGSVVVARQVGGRYRAPDASTPLAPLGGQQLKTSCLTELPGGELWVCADNFGNERMGLGRSSDGVSWTKIMTMLELAGPVACAAGTIQRDQCERGTWCFYKDSYALESDAVECLATDAPALITDEPTCLGCGTGATPSGALPWLAAAVLLRRRRRRRQ